MSLHAFACYSSHDSEYVREVSAFLKHHFEVFLYEDFQRADQTFIDVINAHLERANIFLVFAGETLHQCAYCKQEINAALALANEDSRKLQILPVVLHKNALERGKFQPLLRAHTRVDAYTSQGQFMAASTCARKIVQKVITIDEGHLNWRALDDLPFNPHLFSYEKDIIRFYARKMDLGSKLFSEGLTTEEERQRAADRDMLADGCPVDWPQVTDLRLRIGETYQAQEKDRTVFGDFREDAAKVGAAALRGFKSHHHHLEFLEAGPRKSLFYPLNGPQGNLSVAVLVSGGIAPGINAVIDGIVQRHFKYKDCYHHSLSVKGYLNGFHGVHNDRSTHLVPHPTNLGPECATSDIATLGGSVLGTYRMDELIDPNERGQELERIAERLDGVDILYLIGGDGTMRAAHALWSVVAERASKGRRDFPLSVVAIPKTMDNDILWVWQSFGFMSAVEKAREVIEHLYTEISSNPRLCVLQLFGSDSGFVVSHAVLASAAGHSDLALIPEVRFSLLGIARYLRDVIKDRNESIPRGLLVMAETAIPEDAIWYVETDRPLPDGLSDSQKDDVRAVRRELREKRILTEDETVAIKDFHELRESGRRIQGQTSDDLRRAGLKMVVSGLETILKRCHAHGHVEWDSLRMVANEPRHLLRAIPPSTSDIIMAQRLGTLAVDNAMAGHTDFMISQWLTEYVLVPLKLVVLGRKRIPESGIFWRSVLAKTGQPEDLVSPWRNDAKQSGE